MATYDSNTNSDGMQDKLVSLRRTSKAVTGGTIFGFSAATVVGNGKGKIGFANGKSKEVPVAIQKAIEFAKKNMVYIPLNGNTIHHEITFSFGASTVYMRPAPEGTGIIAGGAMRAVFEVLGIKNVLAKCIGSSSPINVAIATIKGLSSMTTRDYVESKRGISLGKPSKD
jgi:small subunit ribosomal protein S5